MDYTRVDFLEQPIQGHSAHIIINGQIATTSSVVTIQTTPQYPDWTWITTQSGNKYAGPTKNGQHTIYGVPPAGNPVVNDSLSGLLPPATSVPFEIKDGLNWGACILAPLWSGFHNVWIGLLSVIPALGLVMSILLLMRGNEWAWQCRHFRSVDEFRIVQKAWAFWGFIYLGAFVALPLLAILVIIALGFLAVDSFTPQL